MTRLSHARTPAQAAVLSAFAVTLWFVGCSHHEQVSVPAPPPPPPPPVHSATPPAPLSDVPAQPPRVGRPPVIALMRTGDTLALADILPFGRQPPEAGNAAPQAPIQQVFVNTTPPSPTVAGNDLLPPQIHVALRRELVSSGCFMVIERERIMRVVEELELGKTAYFDKQTTVPPGRLWGVHFIVEGSFLAPEQGGDAAAGAERRPVIDRARPVPLGQNAVYLSVYDVETGEVKCVALGFDANPMLAARKAVKDLVLKLGCDSPPIRVAAVEKVGNRTVLTLDAPSQEAPPVGTRLTIVDSEQFKATGPQAAPKATAQFIAPSPKPNNVSPAPTREHTDSNDKTAGSTAPQAAPAPEVSTVAQPARAPGSRPADTRADPVNDRTRTQPPDKVLQPKPAEDSGSELKKVQETLEMILGQAPARAEVNPEGPSEQVVRAGDIVIPELALATSRPS